MAKKRNLVNSTKSEIVLLIIAVVGIGWISTFFAIGMDKEKNAQNILIEQAEIYLEDELYIRAINNYKEALEEYDTENNSDLEEDLEQLYLEAEMLEEYYDLIKERIESGNAKSEEYLSLAKHKLEEENKAKAIEIINNGIKEYPENEELIRLREELIYEYRERIVAISEMKQPNENWIMPAFDGQYWGYVDSSGKTFLEFSYEEVTTFQNGYAVVKNDGIYMLIDENGYRNALDKNRLDKVENISAYAIVGIKEGKYGIYSRTFQQLTENEFDGIYMNENGTYFVKKDDRWALLDENFKSITDYIFKDVAVNSRGQAFNGKYAMVQDEKGYYLIDSEGKELYEMRFVNAKGFEGDLCAVSNANGKWGFADMDGEVIIDYQYVDAYSFSDHVAAVQYAGQWGYINYDNTMVIDAEYVQGYPFVQGKAITKNEAGEYIILQLQYYDLF